MLCNPTALVQLQDTETRLSLLTPLVHQRSQATAGSDGPPKSWLELERERYQQGYMEEQKYWRENGDALRRQAKEEQDRQIKEMKLSAWG